MLFEQPSTKKETVNGYEQGYNFKEVKEVSVSLNTNVGGWEHLGLSKHDRVLIVKKGLGFAKVHGKTYRLEEDMVFEVPAGVHVEMSSSQLIYYCVSAK